MRIHIAQQKLASSPKKSGQKPQNTTPYGHRDNKRIQATQSELETYKTYNCTRLMAEIPGPNWATNKNLQES